MNENREQLSLTVSPAGTGKSICGFIVGFYAVEQSVTIWDNKGHQYNPVSLLEKTECTLILAYNGH